MQRGILLHQSFCDFIRYFIQQEKKITPKDKEILFKIADGHMAVLKQSLPLYKQGLWEKERAYIYECLELFFSKELARDEKTTPQFLELAFGDGEAIGPIRFQIGKEKFNLSGKIDRVDKIGEHEYLVLDYKTGSASYYDRRDYFKAGTHLQPVLYAEVLKKFLKQRNLDANPNISRAGYYFPTPKGKNKEILFNIKKHDEKEKLLLVLFDILNQGIFFVTKDMSETERNKTLCFRCDYKNACFMYEREWVKGKYESDSKEIGKIKELKLYA